MGRYRCSQKAADGGKHQESHKIHIMVQLLSVCRFNMPLQGLIVMTYQSMCFKRKMNRFHHEYDKMTQWTFLWAQSEQHYSKNEYNFSWWKVVSILCTKSMPWLNMWKRGEVQQPFEFPPEEMARKMSLSRDPHKISEIQKGEVKCRMWRQLFWAPIDTHLFWRCCQAESPPCF